MLRSDLCHFSEAYIVVKGKITVTDPNDATKINNALIYNAEDSGIVIPMYNLLEYSKNYGKTTGSLWNYYRDKPNSGTGGENNNVNYSVKDSKSFDYNTSITGKLKSINRTKDVEIVVPLKCLTNFWTKLNVPLINCKINLILTWYENCVLINKQQEMLFLLKEEILQQPQLIIQQT